MQARQGAVSGHGLPADLPALVKSEPHTHTALDALLPQSSLVVLGAQVWFGQPPGKDGAPGVLTAEDVPALKEETFFNSRVINDFEQFFMCFLAT